MLSLSLVLVLTSTLAAELPPRELIAHLDSPDRVVREEAARTLEELGAEALPALRAALEAAKEPEARDRLTELIARVVARSLDRPTMVALDVDDRPLGEAVEALATRSGFALTLDAPALAGKRVTVRASGSLPFWEAVDRLGRAGHVRDDPGPHREYFGRKVKPSTIYLVAGDPPALTAYSGPLRIHLFAAHRHRDVNFEADSPSRDVQKRSATVTIEVQAFVEPGRFLNANGLPRLEAVDERGRAISPQPAGASEHHQRGGNSWLIPGRISLLHWHVPLGLPDLPVRSPLKLRGVLPVVITSRRPDPLVIPMVGTAGKTFRLGPRVVRIENTSGYRPGTTMVEISLSEDAIPADHTRTSIGPETDYIGDFLSDRIEFDDAEGYPLRWHFLFGSPASTTNDEIKVQTFVSGPAPPVQLRVYRLYRLATEIPFEFAEIPSP
jgi:hypothetical protein